MTKLGFCTVAFAVITTVAGCAATVPTPPIAAPPAGESRSGDDTWAERFASKQAWPRPLGKRQRAQHRRRPALPVVSPSPAITPKLWSPQHCWLLELRPCLLCSPAQRVYRPC